MLAKFAETDEHLLYLFTEIEPDPVYKNIIIVTIGIMADCWCVCTVVVYVLASVRV